MTPVHDLVCARCGREARTGPTYPVHCLCGGLWLLTEPRLPVPDGERGPNAGGGIPLWPDPRDPDRWWWKREDLNRTGSFKDRGAEVLAAVAVEAGAERLVLDSSGSAALAGASAAARVDLPLTVHTPESLSSIRREAIEVLGARVVARGDRAAAARRAREEAEGAFYFSHVYHPAFFEGTAASGAEVLASTADRAEPVTWVVPVGNGSLLLGLDRALVRAGVSGVRLTAVQAAACPGLRRPGCRARTAAAGIGIPDPPRREEILAALERHGGGIVEVEEEEIAAARDEMGRIGLDMEPAAASAAAAVGRLRSSGHEGVVVAWLTGSGLRG